MPVLFALSILAFAAFLWATISIAGFVRRAHRRRSRREEHTLAAPPVPTDRSAARFERSFTQNPSAPAPPPPPIPGAEPDSHDGKLMISPERAYSPSPFAEGDMPPSVDGIALPSVDSEPSRHLQPPGGRRVRIHSDRIH